MKANEKRADEVVTACSRASFEGVDPRSVILIALEQAERRGEERALRIVRALHRDVLEQITTEEACGGIGQHKARPALRVLAVVLDDAAKARRARGGERS